ncbi:hypothetical protein C5615_37510 [Burkholderia cepacia]|uniref:Lipoprotein n=1 Tax=Burkholderia cepacia TaxID=292 RepID=A0A2S8HZ23_BURCE|nr:hypothetical protein [Burkholderia cepacia]PQP07679.1 hypothetical protein C5615_37510 [Burkholderia cepacia]HDR9512025.1 hypothetical protein [Burkholderia cepacia]
MQMKKVILVPALIAVAIMSGCGDKHDSNEPNSAAGSPAQPTPSQAASETPSAGGPVSQAQLASVQQPAVPSAPTPDAEGLIRARFDELFAVDANGNLTPKVPVEVNGTQLTPGVTFGGGVQFGNFAFSQAVGHDFGVRRLQSGFVQIVKLYN